MEYAERGYGRNVQGELTLFGDAPEPKKKDTWTREVFSAWRSGGGSLQGSNAAILGSSVKKARYEGLTLDQLKEAARRLGGSHGHPGALISVAKKVEAKQGGSCKNGQARDRLTYEQLSRCRCAQCREWTSFRRHHPL